MFKYLVIALGAAGLYGILALFGIFQSAPLHAWGHGISWAMLTCGVFALVGGMKLRT